MFAWPSFEECESVGPQIPLQISSKKKKNKILNHKFNTFSRSSLKFKTNVELFHLFTIFFFSHKL